MAYRFKVGEIYTSTMAGHKWDSSHKVYYLCYKRTDSNVYFVEYDMAHRSAYPTDSSIFTYRRKPHTEDGVEYAVLSKGAYTGIRSVGAVTLYADTIAR